jgi:hypothetical protein
MLRRCTRLLQENWSAMKHPGVSRHAQSTFHEGVPRDPPRPERTPYIDSMSPWSQAGRLGPDFHMGNRKMQGFVLFSLVCVSYYAFCLSFDIKAHYVLNNTMHRELHLQRAKTEELQQRCASLEDALADVTVRKTDKDGKPVAAAASGDKTATHTAANPDNRFTATNYEIELVRERERAKELHSQHQRLVFELADVRAENTTLKKQLAALTVEAENLQRLVDKFHSIADAPTAK